MLKSIASDVVMEYLSVSNYKQFLGQDRAIARERLSGLIQKKVEEYQLGVEIVFLALESTHPPGEVAKEYDDVLAAEFDQEATVYEAKVKKLNLTTEANIEARRLGDVAKAENSLKVQRAQSRVERYQHLALSYKAQPYIFQLNAYLEAMRENLKGIRKVIVSGDFDVENIRVDLKPEINPILEGVDVPAENDK